MQRPRTPTRNRRGAMPTTTTLSRSWRCRTRGWGRRPRRARQTSVRSWRRTACCGAARTTCALSTCRAGHSSCWANPRRASTAWNGPLRSSRTISPCSTTPPAASTTQEGRKRRSNCSTAPWIRGAAIAPGWSTTRTSTPCAACRDSSRSWRACRLDAARPPLRGRERPPGAQQRPAIEVEQLQRLIAHGELELPAIPLRVSADLERHLAVELDVHAIAEEVRHALARSDPAPDARSLRQHLRQAHRGEPQLELPRSAQGEGEDAEAEPVAGNGAGRGDAAGAAVDDVAATDLAADRLAGAVELLCR